MFDHAKVKSVYNKTGGTCYYCHADFPPDTDYLDDGGKVVSSRRNWHIEHRTPKSKGGSNHIDNLVPSCVKCNLKKGTQTEEEFLISKNIKVTNIDEFFRDLFSLPYGRMKV